MALFLATHKKQLPLGVRFPFNRAGSSSAFKQLLMATTWSRLKIDVDVVPAGGLHTISRNCPSEVTFEMSLNTAFLDWLAMSSNPTRFNMLATANSMFGISRPPLDKNTPALCVTRNKLDVLPISAFVILCPLFIRSYMQQI